MKTSMVRPIEQNLDRDRLLSPPIDGSIDRAHSPTTRQPLNLEPLGDQAAG